MHATLIALSLGCVSVGQAELTSEQLQDGWISLFDGETLYGWRSVSDADWRVDAGTITVSKGTPGLLRTTTQFADYELHLEFRAPKTTNSGIFLRTSPRPTRPGGDCIELNIAAPDNPFPTGSLVGQQKYTGFVPDDDWHTYDVTVRGDTVTVVLDGDTVVTYRGEGPQGRGFIGLQRNSGSVSFRAIRVRPLGRTSLFNGRDLAGWKTYPEMDSEFSVDEAGHLRVKNGRGQLETTQQFADFVLQLECIVHGEGLNSGIFFRCIPGETMNGYESQIHNGFQEGDRTSPEDCGTGGIFRRQDARRVVANDRAWFYKTIIADGPHIAAWVNGVQVSDWTDKRKPNANPRRGLRTAAGTIMIQGHDPTTDFSFRNLRVVEIAPRSRN